MSPDLSKNDFDNNMNTNEISTMNDQATTAPLRRIKEAMPEFKLYDLEPGREYQFLVYAVNAKGRSHPPVVMQGKTFNDIIGPHGKIELVLLLFTLISIEIFNTRYKPLMKIKLCPPMRYR